MKKILILNGPNLNLLGKRSPEIYGAESFEDFLKSLRNKFKHVQIDYIQTNHEGILIDTVQEAEEKYDAVILNAGGYTHTSVALRDAVEAVKVPVVEVHISNIYEREWFRRFSFLKDVCVFSIVGEGLKGYETAIERLLGDYLS